MELFERSVKIVKEIISIGVILEIIGEIIFKRRNIENLINEIIKEEENTTRQIEE